MSRHRISILVLLLLSCVYFLNSQSERKCIQYLVTKKNAAEIWEGKDSSGKKIFFVSRNIRDSEEDIYQMNKKKIGSCYYFAGEFHPFCRYRERARIVFRCKGHISGLPPEDVYRVYGKNKQAQ